MILAALIALYLASQVIVIDGDTLEIEGERIRLVGVDTPETWRPNCKAERAAGERATVFAKAVIDAAEDVSGRPARQGLSWPHHRRCWR